MQPIDPGASSIVVSVRVRPFTIREAAQLQKTDDGTLFLGDGSLAAAPTPKLNQRGLRSVIKVVDDRCLIFDPPEDNPVQKFSRSVVPTTGKKVKDQVFAFDRIFDDNATQADVYEGTTKGLLDSVLDGYNATVFAYGATGCGKTHTITGTAQHPGIIFLTMQELFEKISERSDEKVTELTLSYLEIYNETIRDLLVPGGSKQGLMLREDSNHAVTVAGLTSHHPKNVQDVMDMIVQGNEYRTVSPTEANAVSSRSHAVLQINVAQKDRNANVNEPHTMATLSIIDLAGSERASATKNRGERLLEGANINKSLLALGGCINALCDPHKKNHVPYRNSKLTRLLKFSLGGNCKTVMIVCISPSSAHYDETQNTLRYANRAKNIQTKVTRNVFNVNRHVKDFLVKIDEQMALINELKAQQKDAERAFAIKARKQFDKRDAAAREGIMRLRTAYENATADRQQKVADMRKLRCVERRIGTLSAWVSAFDTAAAGEDTASIAEEPSLAALRQTARGVLAELEHSRQHLHKKIERCNWERPLDSALQHSISQVKLAVADSNVADPAEAIASLTREAEILKAASGREAYMEVLEQEKVATAGGPEALQALLLMQFQMMAALSDTLSMDHEDALTHGQELLPRLMESSIAAATQVIKPDTAPMSPLEEYAPSKRGTPRRKKIPSLGYSSYSSASRTSMGGIPSLMGGVSNPFQQHHYLMGGSPAKASPRRRKVAAGTRKSVTFTPLKKKMVPVPSKRGVRWRDDESEEGTLADFEKTPQRLASKIGSPRKAPVTVAEASMSNMSSMSSMVDGSDRSDRSDKSDRTDEAEAAETHAENQRPTWNITTVPEEPQLTPTSPELPAPVPVPAYLSPTDLADADESAMSEPSMLVPPEPSSLTTASSSDGTTTASGALLAGKSLRFQAGFLSKSRLSSVPRPGTTSPAGSGISSPSDTERRSTPLRNISLPRAVNHQMTPPSATRIASLSGSLRPPASMSSSVSRSSLSPKAGGVDGSHGGSGNGSERDENRPPPPLLKLHRLQTSLDRTSLSSAGEHSDTELVIDTQKLRSALHSAKKAYRSSLAGGMGAPNGVNGGSAAMSAASSGGGMRRFSAGPNHYGGSGVRFNKPHRVSASYAGSSSLTSSTNGISRQRRRSSERRRTPQNSCSPTEKTNSSGSGSGSKSFLRDGLATRAGSAAGTASTAGASGSTVAAQRRINKGGSLRLDANSGAGSENGSPRGERSRPALTDGMPPLVVGKRRVTTGSAALVGSPRGAKQAAGGGAATMTRPAVVWR